MAGSLRTSDELQSPVSGTFERSGTSGSESHSVFDSVPTKDQQEWENFADKIRHVLRLHFLTPWQKWTIRGLMPVRCIIQIISILLFSSQVNQLIQNSTQCACSKPQPI